MPDSRFRSVTWFALFATALLASGCPSQQSTLPDGGLPELELYRVEPAVILPGTVVKIFGKGFVGPEQGNLLVLLERGGGSRMITPERLDDTQLQIVIDPATFGVLGGQGEFEGTCRVQVDYSNGTGQSAEVPIDWQLRQTLQPLLNDFLPVDALGTVYLGSEVEALGEGFLMGERGSDGSVSGEGLTEFRFSGSFDPDDGSARVISTACALSETSAMRDRDSGPLPAECLGIEPGVFSGDVTVVNIHPDDVEVIGNTLGGMTMQLGPTALTRISPTSASRGQVIELSGRGFASGSATTVVLIDGTFTDIDNQVTDYSGDNALSIVPEVISGDLMHYILRVVSDGKGGITGLGARAGVLRGLATPVVFWDTVQQTGVPLPSDVEFTVLSQLQVVYLKYLPGFTDALREFGLRNVEPQIKARILEVVQRDYQGINVEFRETRPADFIEYGVVEIGGQDPNGRDLIGLDNTMTENGVKDMGNIYFNDVVGGWNAESAESGHLAYGGVFVASYLAFSPKSQNAMPIADPLFDEVFEDFMPSRGGKQVEANEYPDGPRSEQIARAIHALGSMIGNTLTHEWGHTLGLAYGWGPADIYHNIEPAENQIMDAGRYRPFAERAELNGQGPAVWSAENRAYLEEILPVD
jgi:hypothetical protein